MKTESIFTKIFGGIMDATTAVLDAAAEANRVQNLDARIRGYQAKGLSLEETQTLIADDSAESLIRRIYAETPQQSQGVELSELKEYAKMLLRGGASTPVAQWKCRQAFPEMPSHIVNRTVEMVAGGSL